MQRKNFLKWSSLLSFGGLIPVKNLGADRYDVLDYTQLPKENDRVYSIKFYGANFVHAKK